MFWHVVGNVSRHGLACLLGASIKNVDDLVRGQYEGGPAAKILLGWGSCATLAATIVITRAPLAGPCMLCFPTQNKQAPSAGASCRPPVFCAKIGKIEKKLPVRIIANRNL